VPFEIQEMTGIYISEVMEKGSSLSEIQEELVKFIGDLPILGWNLSFDLEFLKNNGIELPNPTIDVMKLAYDLLPHTVYKKKRRIRRRFYLSSIARDFGVYVKKNHRAGADAYLVMKIFEKLMEQLKYKFKLDT
jgi:DNA polymerase III alpha subunit (gram-positive type)